MTANKRSVKLTLTYTAENIDAELRDQRMQQLQAEIRELELDAVKGVSDDILPEGTKALDAILTGLAVEASKIVMVKLIDVISNWLQRGKGSEKVKLQIGDQSVEVTPEGKKKHQQKSFP